MSKYAVIQPDNPAVPSQLRVIIGARPLYSIGPIGLLSRPAIGICGSRDASEKALEYAYAFGREAARQGIVVVSGLARGVDRQAHKGVLSEGGATIGVLPEGIDYFRIHSELKPLVDLDRNFLALSMFDPQTPWQTWNADERNKLIVGLSAGVFVIEARERGGTIRAAYESVRQKKRLWAIDYKSDAPGREGNKKLLASSAAPLENIRDLQRALDEAISQPLPEVGQLVLDLKGQE